MAGDKGAGDLASGWAAVAKSFGVGGVLLVGGFVLIGVAIYKGPEFTDERTQIAVLAGGLLGGCIAIVLGWLVLRRGLAANGPLSRGDHPCDVFIAAPMAGYGNDEAGRKAAVDLVRFVEAAVRRLPGVENVHSPVLARPDAIDYETASTGFDVELEALRNAKRYLLVLPMTIPPGTSVLVTAGMAIALNIPSVVLADERLQELPYLIVGAAQSKRVNVHLHRYAGPTGLGHVIANDGLRLFGEDS